MWQDTEFTDDLPANISNYRAACYSSKALKLFSRGIRFESELNYLLSSNFNCYSLSLQANVWIVISFQVLIFSLFKVFSFHSDGM